MKKTILILGLSIGSVFESMAQTSLVFENSFEDQIDSGLAVGQVFNGKIGQQHYTLQGDMRMDFGWDTTYKYWSGNWAMSRVHYNTVEESDMNKHLYGAIAGKGVDGSEVFAVGQNNAKIYSVHPQTIGLYSFYVTNSTYTYNSMKFGDAFAKKFKAADKDSLILVVNVFSKGEKKHQKRVTLADFRFLDTTKNFLLDTWQKVTLTVEGDSVVFEMQSSDNGSWGMNTPAFFVVDKMTVMKLASVNRLKMNQLSVYPNPVSQSLNIDSKSEIKMIEIFNFEGQKILEQKLSSESQRLNVMNLNPGFYMGIVTDLNGQKAQIKFIKE